LPLQAEGIQLLTQMGFTETQAKLYLALIITGKTDVKTLAKQAIVPRQAVYRTLGELYEKGIVERIISMPQEYKAIPLQDGLEIMISQKANDYVKILEQAKEFLSKFEAQEEKLISENDYRITIVEGKETIVKRTKSITDNIQYNVCVCSTTQRWIHMNLEILENVKEALGRGVKYRMVLENSNGEMYFPKEFKPMLSHPNYEVRMVRNKLKLNAAIFDDKEASFSFYPSRSLSESPMIWTNHPSLLVGFQDHFKNVWRDSEKVDLKDKFR
jgi:HTH-type transcriptional regulator, sugar sensing transcriptional regulator